jgi:dUTP pyrophosphatase
MSILSDKDITELCKKDPPLIQDYLDWEWQLQPAGFDLLVDKIFSLESAGTIMPIRETNLKPQRREWQPDSSGIYHLQKGYYIVLFREVLQIPKNIMALGKPRSTLIRYGGSLVTGVWDPGFNGRSQCGLLVENEQGINIYKNSALMQITFFFMASESSGFQYNYLYKSESGDNTVV